MKNPSVVVFVQKNRFINVCKNCCIFQRWDKRNHIVGNHEIYTYISPRLSFLEPCTHVYSESKWNQKIWNINK